MLAQYCMLYMGDGDLPKMKTAKLRLVEDGIATMRRR